MNCKYDTGWSPKCKREPLANGFCEFHTNMKCSICLEKQAVKECSYCGSFAVCGRPVCDTCICHEG